MKHTAGIAAGAKWRRRPPMISATISPCAIARCASIGSPVTSPIAQTLRIDVRHWSSMRTARPFMSSISDSSPQPSVRGRRPTATSTWSAGSADSSPCALRMRTASPLAFRPCTVQPRCSCTPSRRRERPPAWQLLVVGRQHAVQASTTATSAPSLRYAVPSSSPM